MWGLYHLYSLLSWQHINQCGNQSQAWMGHYGIKIPPSLQDDLCGLYQHYSA